MTLLPPLGPLEGGYTALEWVIRIAALAIVPMRRTPEAARSWLLLILFLPVPGLVLFWAIGRPKFPQWRIARGKAIEPFVKAVAARLAREAPDGECDRESCALAERLGRFPAVGGNAVALIDDYDAVFDRLIADIDAAEASVRLLVYIFADDAVGRRVIAALGRAVARGVRVQVLLDPVGSHKWARRTLRRLGEAGADARAALPFRLLRGRTRRDMRNHRKLFLIDGRIGYAGSQNIVAKDFKPRIVNRELVARIEGPVVAEMEALFASDWFVETEQRPAEIAVPAAAGDAVAQLLPSGADYPLEGFETLLIWQLHRARERVMIVTPYLIPDEDVLGAMRTAVQRGVSVDLIVSAANDQPLVRLAQCSYYDDILASGIRLHAYRGALLHAKNVSIDGALGVVGSSNVDIRSFQLNEEASLLLHGRREIAMLEAIQRGYLDHAETLDLARWRRRPRPRKAAENLARLVSPLL